MIVTAETDELWRAIERADARPAGRARTALLDEHAERADALLRSVPASEGTRRAERADLAAVAVGARVSLVRACLAGGDHGRVPGLMAWLLARYDGTDPAAPPLGRRERPGVLRAFGWAVTGLLQHPDVPLGQIEALLETMADRYAAAGESPAPVLRARFLVARHVHGPEAAGAAFDGWRAAPRGALSGCAGCELTEQVRQLADLGRHREAVALARAVLDGDGPGDGPDGCSEQPLPVIAAVLESLLLTGDAARAAQEHVRAVRLLRTRTRPEQVDGPDGVDGAHEADGAGRPDPFGRADHLLVCARAGRLERGLDLVAEWLPGHPLGSPAARLATAAAAARVLRGLAEAGYGPVAVSPRIRAGDPAGAPPAPSVDELGARLTREARDLAARFDARNGTGTVGDRLETVLDAPPLPDLPIDEFARSPRGARIPPVAANPRRGRRAAGRSDGSAVDAADPETLATAFDAALAADNQTRVDAVLDVWRSVREQPLSLGHERAAARLDAWLAIEELSRSGEGLPAGTRMPPPLATALLAAQQLAAAGLPTEGLLHEQAALLAAAAITAAAGPRPADGQASPYEPAVHRIEQIATLVRDDLVAAGPGGVGLALSRVVLAREIAAAAGDPAGRVVESEALGDPLGAGLAALDSVPDGELDHQQRRARCRLLRLRAADEPPAQAVETLFAAVEALPDGVRPVERAMARADLAAALHTTDPEAALEAWNRAVADATSAGAAPVLGNLLAARATLRHTLGDPGRAVDDLTRAVPLLDAHAAPVLAAQGRFDLARALLDTARPFPAAEIAEAALADLTDLLAARGITPGEPLAAGQDPSAELHLAGGCAFTAAQANEAAGDPARARELAAVSAACHLSNGNAVAQAEAWQLAARIGGPPARMAADLARAADLADGGGDWARAATCRRERVNAVREAQGVEAAIGALDEAAAVLAELGARDSGAAGRHASPRAQAQAARQLRWHRLALADQRARLLAVSGRFVEAMTEVEGLEDEYQELGDAWSARDLKGLRGQLRAELGDLTGALDDLRQAAEESEEAGDLDQTQGLGERLAAVLGAAGRPDEAEAAWTRFCRTPAPV